MDILFSLLLGLHILVGVSIIGLVLLQHGKGADMGAAFGSGSSGSLFGSSGSANFLSHMTAGLAAVFFSTSLGLTYIASSHSSGPTSSVVDKAAAQTAAQPAKSAPEVPAGAPAAPADSKAKDIPK